MTPSQIANNIARMEKRHDKPGLLWLAEIALQLAIANDINQERLAVEEKK